MGLVIVRDERRAVARVRAMRNRVKDVSAAWPSVGSYLSRTVRQQFASRGTRLGTPWAPLKPEYRLWKVRSGYSRSILVMSGDLRSSFVRRPMSIEEYRPQSATFGSSDRKAVWHQYGTRRNGKQVNPPRPMLVITPEVRREVVDIVKRRIVGRSALGRVEDALF